MKNNRTDRGSFQPQVEDRDGCLVIAYPMRKSGNFIWAIMMILISGSLFWGMSGFYQCVLSGNAVCYEDTFDLLMVIGVTVLALLLAYRAACYVINKVEITVSKEGVRVRMSGLPWPGTRRLPAGKIKNVFVTERRSFSRGGSGKPYYSVFIGKPFGSICVFGEIYNDRDAADRLAQRIKRALGTGQ